MGKRKTQWIGGGQNIEPSTDVSTAIGDVIQMIPVLPLAEIRGQPTSMLIEAIYLHFSIHRLLITELDALGFVVWVANLQEAGNLPVQTIDALSLNDRLYGNKAIMMMAPLPVPRIALSGDLVSATVDQEVLTAHHEYQAMRKLDRSSNVLSLIVNSDVSVVCNVFCQWRVLVSYA